MTPAGPAADPAAPGVYGEAWRLAWPLILSNLTVPLLGIVDTAVVGHLPEPHYLGAVAIGALTFNVLYFVFGFLRMGTTGLTAQAFGRADADELGAGLVRALLLAALIAVLLIAGGPLIIRAAFLLFEPTARVGAEFASYVGIRLLGAPAGLANLVLLGWLLGLQNARGPMALLIVTNAVNVALDLLFVLGFGWAVPGVAAATVCAEYGGLALGLWLAAPFAACSRSIATSCCAASASKRRSSASPRSARARARWCSRRTPAQGPARARAPGPD